MESACSSPASDSTSPEGVVEDSKPPASAIFHQRQKWLRCGLHAVNNLLQQDAATPRDFDEISASHEEIAGKGPVLNRLGLGDYDGNTVIEFLQERAGCHVEFIDRRSPGESIREQLADDVNLKGFLLNVHRKRRFVPTQIFSCRHWIAVVRIGQKEWYVIDSNKDNVEMVADVLNYLEQIQGYEKLDANLLAVKEKRTNRENKNDSLG